MSVIVTKSSRYVDKNSVMGGITTINSINNSSTTIINQTGGGGVTPVSYILEWDTTNSYYKPYADKAAAGDEFSAGKLYLGIESINKPTGTQYTLNYDGYFRSTKLYAAEAEVQFVSTIQGLQFDAIAANPGTDFTLWSNNADDGKLYYGLDPVITGLMDHVLEFLVDSSGNRYAPYSVKTAGCFYYGAEPTSANSLKYDGFFYATKLYIGATEVISFPGFGTNHTTAAYGDHTHSYLTDAPSDGSTYGRKDGAWAAVTGGTTPIDDILDWSTNKYTPFAAHPGTTTLQFYLGTTNPTGTTRLNLNGVLYTNGLSISGISPSGLVSTVQVKYTGVNSSESAILGYTTDYGYGVKAQTIGLGSALSVTSTGTLSSSSTNNLININRGQAGSVDITGDVINIIDYLTNSGVKGGKVLSATIEATERISFNPRVVDGASAVAYMFDTHNALSTAGAKLTSWKDQGAEKAFISHDGSLETYHSVQGGLTSGNTYGQLSDVRLIINRGGSTYTSLYPNISDDAGATAYIFDTYVSLTTSTSKLTSFRNNTVERFRVTPKNTELPCGISTTFATVGGIVKHFYTDASTSGTGETDLYSYTVPANVLATNGDMLEAYFDVNLSNTTGALKIYFAGSLLSTSNYASTTGIIYIRANIIRVSSTVARCVIVFNGGSEYIEITSKDWAATNILKITGTASSSTFIAKMGHIGYKPAGIN